MNGSRYMIHRICYRWYSNKVKRRNLSFFRNRYNGLVPNVKDETIPKTLWKYFNAPGNVMFVTTNIVTFTGIVAYHSYVSSGRERILDEKILAIQTSIANDSNWNTRLDSGGSKRVKKIKEILPAVSKKNISEDIEESPFEEYFANKILLEKSGKIVSFNSQFAKISLFNLLYSYYLYKDVVLGFNKKNKDPELLSKVWKSEVTTIQNDIQKKSSMATIKKIPINGFYELWREDFTKSLSNISESKVFNFPNWSVYPRHLQFMCEMLHDNNMNDIEDFKDFYHTFNDKSNELRKILRFWLFDNLNLINKNKNKNSRINNSKNESFYNELLSDSIHDDQLFMKYASILLDPKKSMKRRIFFPSYSINYDNAVEVPSASLDTLLNVLNGFIKIKELQGVEHHNSIIKLISLLKKDCILSENDINNNNNQYRNGDVRVLLLPIDEEQRQSIQYRIKEYHDSNPRENIYDFDEQKKKCLQIVSNNQQAINLLNIISQWKA